MNINCCGYSSVGGRRNNEDAVQIFSCPGSTIAVAADGFGRSGDGDIASRMAVHTICESIYGSAVSQTRMERAIRQANERVLTRNDDGGNRQTTIAALWLDGHHACAAHVGNTRIYQFRGGRILYQSADQVRETKLPCIRSFRGENRLISTLGVCTDINADTEMLGIRPGDAFLLCSDGFWKLVWENEMLEDLRTCSGVKEWLCAMRNRVQMRLGEEADNHTAAVLMVTE